MWGVLNFLENPVVQNHSVFLTNPFENGHKTSGSWISGFSGVGSVGLRPQRLEGGEMPQERTEMAHSGSNGPKCTPAAPLHPRRRFILAAALDRDEEMSDAMSLVSDAGGFGTVACDFE